MVACRFWGDPETIALEVTFITCYHTALMEVMVQWWVTMLSPTLGWWRLHNQGGYLWAMRRVGENIWLLENFASGNGPLVAGSLAESLILNEPSVMAGQSVRRVQCHVRLYTCSLPIIKPQVSYMYMYPFRTTIATSGSSAHADTMSL